MAITEMQARQRYNEALQAFFLNGVIASDMDGEWRPFATWTPLPGDSEGDRIVFTELASIRQGLFGEGNPLQYTNLQPYEMFVQARRTALGFAVDRDAVQQDRVGMYSNAAFDLGAGAGQFRWLRFWELMCGAAFDGSEGFSAFDDTPLISDSHPYTDETGATAFYTNYTDAPFSEAAWIQAMISIKLFRKPQGLYLALPQTKTLVVGPENEELARRLFESSLRGVEVSATGGAAIQNTLERPDRIVVSKALTGARSGFWFVFLTYTDPAARGVLFKAPLEPTLRSITSEDSEIARVHSKYVWWVEQKFGFGAGVPYAVYGSDGSE